jgi:hypothetical protein
MTKSSAAAILGVTVPHFSGKSQADVEAMLAEWKDGDLKKAWRAAAVAHHPDTNPGDATAAARFKEATEAYEFLRGLQVRLREPTRTCPQGHARIPATAKFCHECGYGYDSDPLVEALRRAGIIERNITWLRQSGELDRIRAMGAQALPAQIRLIQQRQRLGLVGQHTGWT